METRQPLERRRLVRGSAYTLDDFRRRYALSSEEAQDLFLRFGPSAIELDLLMRAKKRMPTIEDVAEDLRPQNSL